MSYLKPKDDSRRMTAIALVLLLHAVLLYALTRESAFNSIQVIRDPFEARIIEEMKPSPPVEPQPPPPVAAPAKPYVPLKPYLPPKTYVPAPEVPVQPQAEAEIASVTHVPVPQARASAGPSTGTAVPEPTHMTAAVELDSCVKPEYPPASLQAEESGTVALSFLVDVDGKIIESRIDRSSGHYRLDEAARRALVRCKFRPAYVDGKPRQAWAHIKYQWRLE
jgi:protein TonB